MDRDPADTSKGKVGVMDPNGKLINQHAFVITNNLLADFDPPCGLDFWCR